MSFTKLKFCSNVSCFFFFCGIALLYFSYPFAGGLIFNFHMKNELGFFHSCKKSITESSMAIIMAMVTSQFCAVFTKGVGATFITSYSLYWTTKSIQNLVCY